MVEDDKIDRRRNTEDSLYEVVTEGHVIRRPPLKKQMKVKSSKAEYTFLQFHRIIWTWATKNNKLSNRDLDILLYIFPLITFTKPQFDTALKEMGSTGGPILYSLKKRGWITIWSTIKNKNYYTLTSKTNNLISRLHRMFMLEEQIPTSTRRNVIARSEKKKDKQLMDLFKSFNNKIKEKDN